MYLFARVWPGKGDFLFDGKLPLLFRLQAVALVSTSLPARAVVANVLLDGTTRVLRLSYANSRTVATSGGAAAGDAATDRQRRRRPAIQLNVSVPTVSLSVIDAFRQVRQWLATTSTCCV